LFSIQYLKREIPHKSTKLHAHIYSKCADHSTGVTDESTLQGASYTESNTPEKKNQIVFTLL